jgi:hypothetical protein
MPDALYALRQTAGEQGDIGLFRLNLVMPALFCAAGFRHHIMFFKNKTGTLGKNEK